VNTNIGFKATELIKGKYHKNSEYREKVTIGH